MKLRLGVLLAAAVFFVSAGGAGTNESNDVRILFSTEQSIQLEFTPKHFTPNTIRENGREFVDYSFENAIPLAGMRESGVPDLKFRLLPLGFQSTENNFVQVITVEYEDIPNVLLKPVPALHVVDDMLTIKEYPIDATRYGSNQFLPSAVAELSPVEQTRSMYIGGVKIFPLQYNPVTRTLRRYSRIVVEVVYGAPALQRAVNDDDMLFNGMLLNRETARTWKFGESRALNRTTGAPSVLASGAWYRLTVADEGMYILDASWFTANGINLSGTDPRTIKIYGNGGEQLREGLAAPRPVDLVENAIFVQGEDDGQFNQGDHVIFYGKAVQGIKYDAARKTLRHYIHNYSRVNYYWLTFGGQPGKRMQLQASVTDPATITPNSFMDAVWVEPDTVNLLKSGKSWLSFPINPGGTQLRMFPLAGLVISEPRTYRFTLVAGSSTGSTFNVRESGNLIGAYNIFGVGGETIARDASFELTGDFPIQNNTSQLGFEFRSNDPGASGWLDWVEIVYRRLFEPVNNYLRFRSPDTTGVVEYQLGQFTGTTSVFDVTDYANVKRIGASAGVFRAQQSAGGVSEYIALGSSAYKVPAAVVSIPNQNLRGNAQQYDFIIITSQEFASAANRLKAHRENPAYGGLTTIVVDVNQIYNEFNAGVPDVTAIRDFLKYAYENWPVNAPKFVCFLGQGSYDYKGVLGTKTNYVPTWQRTENPYDDVYSSSSDDYFVRNLNNRPFMVTGRLNARNVQQADQLVNRVIAYDTQSARDSWKFRAMFVGDDGWVGGANSEGDIHTRGAESIANLTPLIFEKKKVYLEEYPTVVSALSRRKPGAYQDIIDEINRGVLIVNFVGHGNPTVWTHEAVFSTQTSIPQLFNANKLSYFFGATCNFSQFDDPSRETGSELLMNRPEGGAIGVVSASRKVFSSSNEALNRGIFVNMFRQDIHGRVLVDRVATALFLYKAAGGSFDLLNDEKYLALGDPTQQLQFPRGYVAIDTINSEPVDFVNGIPRTSPIQLKSLARINVKGSIRNEANALDSLRQGQLTLIVNDAMRSILIPAYNWSYSVVGSLIYRGENSISNGRFSATFIVPKDIAYADSTARGRLVGYFLGSDATSDGVGYTSNVAVSGTDTTARPDTIGPAMRIMLGHSYESSLSFRDGDVVSESPILFVDLEDSSGINTSTSGLGHRIEAWFNGSAQSRDMTEFYTSRLDNFQAGTVRYPLRDLQRGQNTVRVRAWDTYNNARTSEAYFRVLSNEQLQVVDVFNYPNPFTTGTAFTFRHNQQMPVNATIKIYTIAGRLIQTLDRFGAADSYVAIPWDGRDRDGDVLANGVYLYKVLVRTIDGRYSSETLGKLAIAK